jgi:hypothetical protein
VTHREILTLPDGTRVYADGHRYRPVPISERKNQVRRPDDPRAVRFHGNWFLPLQLLSPNRREMPETRPDDQTLEHAATCRCEVCRRPGATRLWRMRAKRESRKKFSDSAGG